MYQVELRYADVTIDPICDFRSEKDISGDPDFICRPNNLTDHHLLNNLTVNVSVVNWLVNVIIYVLISFAAAIVCKAS